MQLHMKFVRTQLNKHKYVSIKFMVYFSDLGFPFFFSDQLIIQAIV